MINVAAYFSAGLDFSYFCTSTVSLGITRRISFFFPADYFHRTLNLTVPQPASGIEIESRRAKKGFLLINFFVFVQLMILVLYFSSWPTTEHES